MSLPILAVLLLTYFCLFLYTYKGYISHFERPAALLPGLAMENGSVTVDRQMATNLPGVFAAGDCTGQPLQIAKAVGEGHVAALSACEYLDQQQEN